MKMPTLGNVCPGNRRMINGRHEPIIIEPGSQISRIVSEQVDDDLGVKLVVTFCRHCGSAYMVFEKL